MAYFVLFKSGGPEAATQVATRLEKTRIRNPWLHYHARLGGTHGYVLCQVDAPDEQWAYDSIARHMSHHGNLTK